MKSRKRRIDSQPRPWSATAVLAGLFVGAVVYAAAELALLQPRAADNATLAAEVEVVRIDNARTEQMVGDYDAFRAEADRVEAEFRATLEAVPTEAELATALEDVEGVTAASGVSLVRFVPGAGAPAPPAATGSDGVRIEARPITASVRCTFGEFRDLLGRLATYPRLLTVEGFTMKSATSGRFTIEATVAMNCYYKQAPPLAVDERRADGGTRRRV
jgi:Tfp pilus assembly protein PilO